MNIPAPNINVENPLTTEEKVVQWPKIRLVANTQWKYVEVNGKDVDIPEGWKVVELGSAFHITGGGTPSTANAEYWGGDIVWTGPKFMSNNQHFVDVAHPDNKKLTPLGAKKIGDRPTPSGSLIVSSRAPVGYANIAPCDLYTNQGCYSFIDKGIGNPIFMYFWVRKNTQILESRASGTTFLEISRKNISLIECPLPTYSVQTLIAKVLTAQEDNIAALKQQVAIQRKRMDWLSDELLSGRIRVEEDKTAEPMVLKRDESGVAVETLPAIKLVANTQWKTVEVNGKDVEIPQGWDIGGVSDYFDVCMGPTILSQNIAKHKTSEDQIPVFSATEKRTVFGYVEKGFVSKNKMLNPGDVVLGARGSIGFPKVLDCLSTSSQTTIQMKSRGGYIGKLFEMESRRDGSHFVIEGGGIPMLTVTNVEKIALKVPSSAEQTLIAKILTTQEEHIASLDKMIAIEEKRLSWLTDELLSGRILVEEVNE